MGRKSNAMLILRVAQVSFLPHPISFLRYKRPTYICRFFFYCPYSRSRSVRIKPQPLELRTTPGKHVYSCSVYRSLAHRESETVLRSYLPLTDFFNFDGSGPVHN